jgi:hypothetical protein
MPHKSSHPFSLSLSPSTLGSYVSKLKQQSNDYPTRKESVLYEFSYPRQLEPNNHTSEPSSCVLQVPLIFGKHHFIHTCLRLLQLSVRLCVNLVF